MKDYDPEYLERLLAEGRQAEYEEAIARHRNHRNAPRRRADGFRDRADREALNRLVDDLE